MTTYNKNKEELFSKFAHEKYHNYLKNCAISGVYAQIYENFLTENINEITAEFEKYTADNKKNENDKKEQIFQEVENYDFDKKFLKMQFAFIFGAMILIGATAAYDIYTSTQNYELLTVTALDAPEVLKSTQPKNQEFNIPVDITGDGHKDMEIKVGVPKSSLLEHIISSQIKRNSKIVLEGKVFYNKNNGKFSRIKLKTSASDNYLDEIVAVNTFKIRDLKNKNNTQKLDAILKNNKSR